MSHEDKDIVDRCLQGSNQAYVEFVERFQGLICGFCHRMLGNRHDAEDVAQEVFLRALRGLHRWDPARPLRPWLMTIAANRCRTHLSQNRRRPATVEFLGDLADSEDDDQDARELHREIRSAVDGLRAEHREVFLLFHEEGLNYQEMSEVLDRPVGTLKTWLHRARRQVLECLQAKGLVPEEIRDVSEI